MDDKDRMGSELEDDLDDLSPLYSQDSEDDDEIPARASTRTRMLPGGQNRGRRPGRSQPTEEPARQPQTEEDPYDGLTKPPLSVHDRKGKGFGPEIEESDDDDDDDALADAFPEDVETPVEDGIGRRVPMWAWVSGIGGAMLLLVLLFRLLWPAETTYVLKVYNAPAGSTLYIDNLYSGVPDATGIITAKGLQRSKKYNLRITNPVFQEVSIPDVQSEDGTDQRVDLPNPVPIRSQPTPQPSTLKPPPRETSSSEIDYNGPMVEVAAGEFTLGDDTHLPDERPSHKVTVAAFYIDKYEVTNEQYKKFCEATERPLPQSPSWDPKYVASNPRGPVTGVSWDDAAAYAAWANKRLPSEAEWEKAASWDPATGQKRLWPWGNARESGRTNIMRQSPRLAVVGQYDHGASSYGALDMAGNVAEWVDGFYEPYEGNTVRNTAFGEKYRLVRGGSCLSSFDDARTTRRFYYSSQERNKRDLLVGFRCAVSADDPGLQKRLQDRTN